MKKYLTPSTYIDCNNAQIKALAGSLSSGCHTDEDIAKNCFEWVRDNIKHSVDFKLNPITCKASDVLKHKTGYCYAKSHLLAALLRANGIPAGLCYQRLSVHDNGAPFCLHGLNAVYLEKHGWYRIDARGNKSGVNAQFSPPVEKLAFAINLPQEASLPKIWPEPIPAVVSVLENHNSWQQVQLNLPGIEKILISACLLGETVRYDGKNKLIENDILKKWIEQHRVVSFCPEVAAGLPVPRMAAEICGGNGNDVLAGVATVIDKTGHNVTDEFITGAKQALSICQQFDINLAVLAGRSPSCGNKIIYDGSFNGTTISGAGVTAALLQQHDIKVFNQTEFTDAEDFIMSY